VALLTVSCEHRRCLTCTVSTDGLLATEGRAYLTRVIGSAVVANRVIYEWINRSIEGSRPPSFYAVHEHRFARYPTIPLGEATRI
jgi:hypothetical protein